jgi:large subunit ribosomal protein L15
VGRLEGFEEGAVVDPQALRAAGVVKGKGKLVKVLGEGELTKRLTVKAHAFSSRAREKISAAGGGAEPLSP